MYEAQACHINCMINMLNKYEAPYAHLHIKDICSVSDSRRRITLVSIIGGFVCLYWRQAVKDSGHRNIQQLYENISFGRVYAW